MLILLVLLVDLVSSRWFFLLVCKLLSHLFLLLSAVFISTVAFSVMTWVILSWIEKLIHILIDWDVLWVSHTTKCKCIWLSVRELIFRPVVVHLWCLWILGSIDLTLIISVLISVMKIIIVNWRSGMTFMFLMKGISRIVQQTMHISCISEWATMIWHTWLVTKLFQID